MSVPNGSPWGKPGETDDQPQLVIRLAFSYQPQQATLALLYPWVMHIQCALFMDFTCVLSYLSRRLEDNASSHANLPLAGFQISLDVIAQKGSPGPHLTCQRCAPLKLQQIGFFWSSNGHHAEGFFTKYQLVLALLLPSLHCPFFEGSQ